ncbi:mitochondrial fission ELM1 family protein [Pseudaminobacter soli (ex Li et al. 2025)]|nr:mitochondrial fission ELM1 family protein [Mesorhizobium soli]
MRVWTVSEEKAGTLTQCLGVAQNLDRNPTARIFRKQTRAERIFSAFRQIAAEKAPDIVISCGSISERYVADIKKAYGGRSFTVHLQPPRRDPGLFDMVFVSRHDWTEAMEHDPKYFKMVGVPHRISPDLLAARREGARARFAPGGEPVVTLLIGGSTWAYAFDRQTIERIIATATDLVERGYVVLASTSRRSEPEILARLMELNSPRMMLWDRTGDNPYIDYLAAADAFIITADTVTMVCEASMSGKPIHIFPLARQAEPQFEKKKFEKFERFHADMRENIGFARPFQGVMEEFSYPVEDETLRISSLIRTAYEKRESQS